MENTNEINYVCARWRDAITDPPPFLWKGQVMDMAGGTHYMIRRTADFIDHLGRVAAPDAITSWLDITDIPAVAREAVQAAVDEMDRCEGEADEAVKKSDRETDRCYRGGIRTCLGLLRGIRTCLGLLREIMPASRRRRCSDG